jgi:carbon storage regulator
MKGVSDMLVLSRKANETIVINGNIRITVVSVRGKQVRLGMTAPDSMGIFREELCSHAGTGEKRAGPDGTGLANGEDAFCSTQPIRHPRSRHEP